MRLIAWSLVGVAAVWFVMSMTYPFGWDQGLFAWGGDVILRGGTPYVDAWDMKGPLVYYIYAASQAAFGVNLWGIRVVDALLLLPAAWAVFRAARALTDRTVAGWAALLFVLWYASHSYWHTAQPDGWTGLMLVLAIAPLIVFPDAIRPAELLAIGAGIGLTALFKPLWILFLLLPMAHVLIARPARRIASMAWLLCGWLVPILVTIGWFASRGALHELIAVHLQYSAWYAQLGTGDRLRGFVDYVVTNRVVDVALPIVGFGAVVLWRTRRAAAVVLIGWILVVGGGVILQGRFFAYHWLPLLPPAALLGAVGLAKIRSGLPALAAILCAVMAFHCVAPIVLEESRFISWLTGRIGTEAYYAAYGGPGDDMRAVRWLRDTGRPGDVYVFGWEAGVAWLSERRFVSRFGFSMPLLIEDGHGRRAQYRAELLSALAATPPRYLLSGTQSGHVLGGQHTIADFPELAVLVAQAYTPAAQFGPITIYERR